MICINRDRERLVESHLEIVGYEVAALLKRGEYAPLVRLLGRDEAIAVGNLALCEASQTFDFDRGVQFKTYASAAISRAVLDSAIAFGRHDSRSLDDEPADDERPGIDREFLQRQLPELSASENAVVHLRSLQQLPWDEVARRMGYTQRGAEKAYDSAIEKLKLRSVDIFG